MRLNAIVETTYGAQPGNSTKELHFLSQYDSSLPEDQRFQKATPNASAKFQIDNPEALAAFEVGKSYYFDFTPVDETPK